MVKLGFIGEGAVEKIILESDIFQEYLTSLGIDFIDDVVDATGNGNLLPYNREKYTQILKDKGATDILILTDLDTDQCITITKQRIGSQPKQIVIISIKEIEAWFLADKLAMQTFLQDGNFICDAPESILNPFERIRHLRLEKLGKGIPTKKILANLMVHRNNFSIIRAGNHPNCKSAKYFLNKLQQLASQR